MTAVSRIKGPAHCDVHGQIVDLVEVDGAFFCTRCAARAARETTGTAHNPWFYTNSPHGMEILSLGLSEVELPKKEAGK